MAAPTRQRPLAVPALEIERPAGGSSAGWGMALFITTEAMLFASLFASYYYLRFRSSRVWPLDGIEPPDLSRAWILTALIVPSSLPMAWAVAGVQRGRRGAAWLGVGVTLLLGAAFVAVQCLELAADAAKFSPTMNAYGSIFYAIEGLDAVHVLVGVLMLGFVLAAIAGGRLGPARRTRTRVIGMYWHFVNVMWLAVLLVVHVSPHV
ncbi:MAG TPA: cytochrome c oxidase subunit 3 [Actinomycetota bacterium]|jgi:heme/copper-type cytochrome/quinol oxidase subunit 3|nr:cytochrome c oxidase subunit 3 [Actinomycetota bacterium]